MDEAASRTLDELVALYQLEPELRDIYVEGSNDQSFVEWFLGVQGSKDVVVKDVGCVHIPVTMVLERGLEDNQRGRVITLAHYLEDKFGSDFLIVICIADADFDHIRSLTHSTKILLLTDYTSLELYFFNVHSLTKLLKLAVPGFPKTPDRVIQEIRPTLEDLFVVRMANSSLGWGLREVSSEKSCQVRATGVEFDFEGYIARYLQANNRSAEKGEFVEAITESRGQLTTEPRIQIHGHDFVRFLAWYIRQHKGFKSVRDDVVERALFASAESSQLMSERLFQSLLKWLQASNSSD
jgi:hypothetical protein